MTKNEVLEDSELIAKISSTNDPYWFGKLYDRHAKAVYNKCLFFVHEKQDAEDLTHDIFLKVFISLKQFKGGSLFKTWLLTITYNFCISFIRKKDKGNDVNEDSLTETPDEIDDNDILRLRIIELEMAMKEIKPEEKMILLMKYQDDMSLKEIEEAMGIGESAVKMRLKRAKAKVMELCNATKIY